MTTRTCNGILAVLLLLLLDSGTAAADGVPSDVKKKLKAGLADVRREGAKEAARTASSEAVRLLIPLAAADRDGDVRDVAFTELQKQAAPVVIEAIVEFGIGSKKPMERAIAAELLGAMRADAAEIAGAALVEALADRDREVRLAAAEAVGLVKVASAGEPLRRLVADGDDPLLRVIAVESLSRIGGDDVTDALSGLCSDANDAVAAQALESLAFHDRAAAAAAAAGALRRQVDDPALRAATLAGIEVARVVRRPEPIPALIALLEHPRGRVVDLVFSVLREVTAMELPDDPKSWKEWWEHYGDGFEVPATRSAQPAQPGDPTGRRSRVRFYGTPIVSDRVVFVIDFSGSMRDPDASGRPKIDGARDALREALEAMPEAATFNVVAFGDEPRSWKDALVPVNAKNVDDAIKFLKGAGPKGYTNLYDALEVALADPDADTIVLLSDGAPSIGKYEYFSRIRHHVGRMNRLRRVAISAVALQPTDHARSFLERLAKETGGSYSER